MRQRICFAGERRFGPAEQIRRIVKDNPDAGSMRAATLNRPLHSSGAATVKASVTKCPKCWAEKAYLDETKSAAATVLSYLFVVPMSCQHCFHRFRISWFSTFGKELHPPAPLRIFPASTGPSYAARQAELVSSQADPQFATPGAERKAA